MSERTLAPSQRKLREARRSGDVPVSPMLTAAAALTGASVALGQLGTQLASQSIAGLEWLTRADVRQDLTARSAIELVQVAATPAASTMAVIAVAACACALLAGFAQTRAAFSPLRLSLGRLNPAMGISRMPKALFNQRTLVMLIAAATATALIWNAVTSTATFTASAVTDLGGIAEALAASFTDLLARLAGVAVIAGVVDRLLVGAERDQRLRMSPDERRREDREESGNPYVQGTRRERARQHSKRGAEAAR